MQYPTHSFGMLLSALDTYVTKISAFGYVDTEGDGIYGEGLNDWDNPFSNMITQAHLNNGGVGRVSECRRIGVHKPSSYISGVYGTRGGYEYSNAQHLLVEAPGKQKPILTDVSDRVNPMTMTPHRNEPDFKQRVARGEWSWDNMSPIQNYHRLPREFEGMPNGHMGSHQLLVDDFCRAVSFGPTAAGQRLGSGPVQSAGDHRPAVGQKGRRAHGCAGFWRRTFGLGADFLTGKG